MNRRIKSVHRGGAPLPDGDDIVFQYGPRGLMLNCIGSDGYIVAREPFDLGRWQ